jgi:mRNA interferase RelE/StbE
VKTIIFSQAAAKDLDGLSSDAREAVQTALIRYAMTGEGDVKSLSGRAGFRLRIGNYRVIFDQDASTILAIYIGRRQSTTYRRN